MDRAKLEILVIAGDVADADNIRNLLPEGRKQEFQVNHVRLLTDGLSLLENRAFDVVLLDLALPNSQGPEAARAVRHRSNDTPIIALAASEDEEEAIRSWQTDIQDCLVKDEISSVLLTRSIGYAIGQKHAIGALRECEERFHATFDQAAIGISHVAPDGTWLRINRTYCDIVGYSEDEMQALTIRDITHPDDREISMKHFRSLLAGQIGNYSLEKRYIHKDGSIVWVNLTASIVSDAQGNPRFVVGFVEDITPRRRVEQALRLSEDRYKALYQDNPTMIATIDPGLKMLSVNPFCARQLGYSIEELEGRSVLDIFHPDDRPAVAEQLRNCLRNPYQVYRWQFRKVCKDRSLLWVEETAQAVYNPLDDLNVLVVCQDITERKRKEEQIERLNNELAARAAELEATNRELETFNYTVAHDLRKPLTVINLLCQKIEEQCGKNLGKECRGYLQETYKGTLRMNQLIEALLSFSHLARTEPHRQEIDLAILAQAAAAELEKSRPERRITFLIAEKVVVRADPDLLLVVLDNLFDNACKHTLEREEAVIEFDSKIIDGMPAYFVRDNGTGFDMADADKLFTPFQSLPGAEESKGFGIGLATVERIIRRHGGRVWARGEPGKGATFYFTLGPLQVR
jgi:PAS domain S-box-containing protein